MSDCNEIRELVPRALFKALADPTRIAILDRICCACGPQSVGEVAAGIDADLSVVSRSLVQLRDAGLLRCERDGKRVLCRLDTSEVVAQLRMLADALEGCCGDEPESRPQRTGARV